jgi:maltose O-acetyltransferase
MRFVVKRILSNEGPPWTTQALARIRARALFRACTLGEAVYAYGYVRVIAQGEVILGPRVFFIGGMIPSEVVCPKVGRLSIGAGSGFNYGVSIEARERVVVGSRCMIASMTRISDSSGGRVAPITIGDDVWIAHGATIEPGAVIGNGSVVSAGSVVTGEIPPGSLALGNPARPIKLDLVNRQGKGADDRW